MTGEQGSYPCKLPPVCYLIEFLLIVPQDMAPEILEMDALGRCQYDTKADVFSVAFILYETWFGQHPFHHTLKHRTIPLILSPFLLLMSLYSFFSCSTSKGDRKRNEAELSTQQRGNHQGRGRGKRMASTVGDSHHGLL